MCFRLFFLDALLGGWRLYYIVMSLAIYFLKPGELNAWVMQGSSLMRNLLFLIILPINSISACQLHWLENIVLIKGFVWILEPMQLVVTP